MIAIFKEELETIDVFRSFLPIGDVLEHECDRPIFPSRFLALSSVYRLGFSQNISEGMFNCIPIAQVANAYGCRESLRPRTAINLIGYV